MAEFLFLVEISIMGTFSRHVIYLRLLEASNVPWFLSMSFSNDRRLFLRSQDLRDPDSERLRPVGGAGGIE